MRLRRHRADTLAYLGAAIRLYRDTFASASSAAKAKARARRQDGDGQQPTGKAGERFKVTGGCQPPRSFWIRARQYTPGPITCGVCGQDFQPENAATKTTLDSHAGNPQPIQLTKGTALMAGAPGGWVCPIEL